MEGNFYSNKNRGVVDQSKTISKYFISSTNRNNLLDANMKKVMQDEIHSHESSNKLVKEVKEHNLNTSVNDEADFRTPKQLRMPKSKLFNKQKGNKRGRKPKFSDNMNKQMILTKVKSTDVNQEHLELAIALSRSMQSNDIDKHENNVPSTSKACSGIQQINSAKKTLEEFGFKAKRCELLVRNYRTPVEKRKKKSRFQCIRPILFLRTQEDREKLITEKIAMLLSHNMQGNIQTSFEPTINHIELFSKKLQMYWNGNNRMYKINTYDMESLKYKDIFYVKALNIPTCKAKCGHLLKNWNDIPGRTKSPERIFSADTELNTIEDELTKNDNTKLNETLTMGLKIQSLSEDRSISPDIFCSDDEVMCTPKETFQDGSSSECFLSAKSSLDPISLVQMSQSCLNPVHIISPTVDVPKVTQEDNDSSSPVLTLTPEVCVSGKDFTPSISSQGSCESVLNVAPTTIKSNSLTISPCKINMSDRNLSSIEDSFEIDNGICVFETYSNENKYMLKHIVNLDNCLAGEEINNDVMDLTQSSNESFHEELQNSQLVTDYSGNLYINNSSDIETPIAENDGNVSPISSNPTLYAPNDITMKHNQSDKISEKKYIEVGKTLNLNTDVMDLTQSSNESFHEELQHSQLITDNSGNIYINNSSDIETPIAENDGNVSPILSNPTHYAPNDNTIKHNQSDKISEKKYEVGKTLNLDLTQSCSSLSPTYKADDEINLGFENIGRDILQFVDCVESRIKTNQNNYDDSAVSISIDNENKFKKHDSFISATSDDFILSQETICISDEELNYSSTYSTPSKRKYNLYECSNLYNDFVMKKQSSTVTSTEIDTESKLKRHDSFILDYYNLSQETIYISDEELNYSSTYGMSSNAKDTSCNYTNTNTSDVIREEAVSNCTTKMPKRMNFTNECESNLPIGTFSDCSKKNTDEISYLHTQLEHPKEMNLSRGNISKSEKPHFDENKLLDDSLNVMLEDSHLFTDIIHKTDHVNSNEFPVEPTQSNLTPLKLQIPDSNTTPKCKMIIKTTNVTPMVNYAEMNTPKVTNELEKFGLKPLKRQRGIQILKHIYDTTHPIVQTVSSYEKSDSEEENRVIKRKKSNMKLTRNPSQSQKRINYLNKHIEPSHDGVEEKIEIVGNLMTVNESIEDIICERKQSTKVLSCRIPLHIAWHNLLSSHPEMKKKVLMYSPLQLEEVYNLLKEQGFKYHIQDLLTFFDKKCITVRTNQNNSRNAKYRAKSKSPRKSK